MVRESHFSDFGSGRPGLPAAAAKAGVWLPPRQRGGLGLGGPGPSLPYTPPSRVLPFFAPPPHPPSPIPAGPGFLTWSRPGLQLPDVPPPPAPTGHSPRPARPARCARAPPWRTWVSGARVPLSPAPPRRLDPLPRAGNPSHSPHLPIPASCLLDSGLCPRLLSDSTSPFLPLPSCLFLDWPLPPFFPRSAPPSLAADGWAGRCSARQWAPGLRGAGRGGVKGVWGPGTGEVDRRGRIGLYILGKKTGPSQSLGKKRTKDP